MSGATPLRILAHGKLNLSLVVLAQEASGFHQVETVFCCVALADEVDLMRGSGSGSVNVDVDGGGTDRLRVHVQGQGQGQGQGAGIGAVEQNLAYRAAVLFHERTGTDATEVIRLVKRIPVGGGMGGGSSDAAAVLRGLNRLHGEPLDRDELLRLGAGLGSDVPFFLAGAVLARAGGRGGRIMPLPALPSVPVLLALPPVAVSTAEAFAALAAGRPVDWMAPPVVMTAVPGSWEEIATGAGNDFEDVVFPRLPLLRELRDALRDSGATVARMTGTGSTVFGIFATAGSRDSAGDSDARAAAARDSLATAFPDTRFLLTHTLRALEE
jgi:4-diphosphocytidyl-2-C-methyl-D-erythritol kinase